MNSDISNIVSSCIEQQPVDNGNNVAVSESSHSPRLHDSSLKEKPFVEEKSELPMSKSQMKKMLKKERWQTMKAERSRHMKEKRKIKRREQRESGIDTGPSKKELKKNTMKNSTCKIQVAIDCSFDELMVDRDICKLGQQIQYCYSSNRRASQPLQLFLTSLGSKTQERLDRIGDYRGWDINIKSRSYMEEFNKESIVYLTSDSPNVLESLSPTNVYIIGGLVDHNHHKGLCFEMAEKHGVGHAQLPISEYVQLSSRKVLTVNHVFEILLNFTETHSWKESFYRVIPRRKHVGESRQERRKKKDHDDADQEHDSSEENDDLLELNSEDERDLSGPETKRLKVVSANEQGSEVSGSKQDVVVTYDSGRVDKDSEDKQIDSVYDKEQIDRTLKIDRIPEEVERLDRVLRD